MAVDYTTAVGKLRALIPDIEEIFGPNKDEFMFGDAQLNVYLDLAHGNTYFAAADACEVLGTSEALILKVLSNQDQQTDGAKMMQQFLQRAQRLRERAAAENRVNDAEDEGTFFIVDFAVWPPHLEPR